MTEGHGSEGLRVFDEARQLFYAAALVDRSSGHTPDAAPLLIKSVLLLMRSIVISEGAEPARDADSLLEQAATFNHHQRAFTYRIDSDVPFLRSLVADADDITAQISPEDQERFDDIVRRMPRVLTEVRRFIRSGPLTPEQRARRRRRARLTAIASIVALVGAATWTVSHYAVSLYESLVFDGIAAIYYGDAEQKTIVSERVDRTINFDWADDAPSRTLPADGFSVRWVGRLIVPKSGDYTFYLGSDDGARLFLDGKELIDSWRDHTWLELSATTELKAGEIPIRVDYFERSGKAAVKLSWSREGMPKQPISGHHFTH